MHFRTHEVGACQDDTNAQGIAGVSCAELLNDSGKIPFINGIPRDRNSNGVAHIGPMGICHPCLESLRAVRVDRRGRISSGLEAELIFHPNAAEDSYSLVNRAEIRFPRFSFDLIPWDMQTYAA